MYPDESEAVTTLAHRWIHFSIAYCATFPEPETTTVFPFRLSFFVANISWTKYTNPYPVASVLINDPHRLSPLPVNTPVNSFLIFLYCPNIYPISLPPTPMSPAGTSVSGQICLCNSVMNDWQNLITSASDLSCGSKSLHHFPHHIGNHVKLFLKICSKPRNFKIDRFTLGWNLSPPLYGPIALLNWTLYHLFIWIFP